MEWALAILRGIGYGLFLGMMSFGPAFFALIQVGMQGGKKAGWRMATGIFLADLVVALVNNSNTSSIVFLLLIK